MSPDARDDIGRNTFVVANAGPIYRKDRVDGTPKDPLSFATLSIDNSPSTQFEGPGRNTIIVNDHGTIYKMYDEADADTKVPRAGNAIETAPRVIEDAGKELKRTIVSAYLQYAHRDGESVMWCTTAQLAWNEFVGEVGKPLQLSGDPAMARFLNERLTSKDDLDEASYIALGGKSDTVRPGIAEQWKKKFPKASPLKLPDEPAAPAGAERLTFFAGLFKHLTFEREFTAFETHINFQSTDVQGFGLSDETRAKDWDKAVSQVKVWYRSDNEFAVELITTSAGERMILARLNPGMRLLDTIQAVRLWTSQPQSDPLVHGERLEIPMMNFDLNRNYDEVVGNSVEGWGEENLITQSLQRIKLDLNERGAVLESFAVDGTWVIANGEESPKPKLRRFVFDGPFLMLLTRKDAKMPYFAFWVANAELLVPAKPHRK